MCSILVGISNNHGIPCRIAEYTYMYTSQCLLRPGESELWNVGFSRREKVCSADLNPIDPVGWKRSITPKNLQGHRCPRPNHEFWRRTHMELTTSPLCPLLRRSLGTFVISRLSERRSYPSRDTVDPAGQTMAGIGGRQCCLFEAISVQQEVHSGNSPDDWRQKCTDGR